MRDNCVTCGLEVQGGIYLAEEGVKLCAKCGQFAYKCEICRNQYCALRNYQGPKPPMVTITQQNGNMTIQRTIPNPEVVKECCGTCSCFKEGSGCFQQVGSCENFVLFRRDENTNQNS
jgi:hypothetical protein